MNNKDREDFLRKAIECSPGLRSYRYMLVMSHFMDKLIGCTWKFPRLDMSSFTLKKD